MDNQVILLCRQKKKKKKQIISSFRGNGLLNNVARNS